MIQLSTISCIITPSYVFLKTVAIDLKMAQLIEITTRRKLPDIFSSDLIKATKLQRQKSFSSTCKFLVGETTKTNTS